MRIMLDSPFNTRATGSRSGAGIVATVRKGLAIVLVLVAIFGGADLTGQVDRSEAQTANPIQAENNLPGDPSWNDFSAVLQDDAISGYGSKISLNHGDSIDFFVTTTAPS